MFTFRLNFYGRMWTINISPIEKGTTKSTQNKRLGSRCSRWSWYGWTTRAWRMITASIGYMLSAWAISDRSYYANASCRININRHPGWCLIASISGKKHFSSNSHQFVLVYSTLPMKQIKGLTYFPELTQLRNDTHGTLYSMCLVIEKQSIWRRLKQRQSVRHQIWAEETWFASIWCDVKPRTNDTI